MLLHHRSRVRGKVAREVHTHALSKGERLTAFVALRLALFAVAAFTFEVALGFWLT